MKSPTLFITPLELKQICDEYTLKEGDELKYNDEYYTYLQALQKLDKADFIIWCLYTHFGSERKTAKALGVSRTPLHRLKLEIRDKIITHINNLKL